MKYALIIGNNKYDDPKLAQLKTPAADSQALAKVLDDKAIGSFDEVTSFINQTEARVSRAISLFLTNKKPDDLVLLYFSGHGVLDDRGRLYLALKDTQVNLLKATSIPSSFVADEMDSCRSKRQILILDCCHSGAFARGTKGEQKAITENTFEGSGFGRVVLTASDSTQYALEGDQVIKQTEFSLFTHFLLEGLKTGEADTNNDGHISLDEWYDYTYAKVISETPKQVPHKWSYNQRGDLIIAKNAFLKKRVAEIPYELTQALESSFVGIRESAVNELGKYLHSHDSEMADLAASFLDKMKSDDSRRISSLAEKLLLGFEQARRPVIEVTVPKPSADAESVKATLSSYDSISSLKTDEIKIPAELRTPQLTVESPSVSEEFSLDKSFWFKWIGSTALGVILVIILYGYSVTNLSTSFSILFAGVTSLTSLGQWWAFRNRLASWWIAANTAVGAVLGGIHFYRYNNSDWGNADLGNLIALWIIGNFIVGLILIRKGQPTPIASQAELIKAGKRSNSFLVPLSIFLVVCAFDTLVNVINDSGLFNIDSSIRNAAWTLYGITSILVGISFVLIKGTPKSFGFVSIAIFLFLNGLVVELLAFYYDEALFYFFFIPGIMALLSGAFFVFQKETWKHFDYIMLSGFLIFISLIYFGVDALIVSMITAICALLAAVLLFRRK